MADSSDEQVVQLERADGVGWIILNRPTQINAINTPLRRGVMDALEAYDADPEISVIALRGQGERGFCAGADIKEERKADSLTEYRRDFVPWIQALDRTRKPVIAAIHGFCLGGGLEIALACDIRIAAPGAQFGLPEVNLGLIPGGGGTQRLPRLIGLGRAMDLLLTGDRIDAAEAHRIGLVSRLTASAESLVEEVSAIAKRIAAKPPTAVSYAKEAARTGVELELKNGLRLESDLFTLLLSTEDRKEAAIAFREKRPPRFTGK